MAGFENLRFKGTFRDYQQRVLDRADSYIKDGKINIVAAPGSGKTVLGLELIRRLGEPCLVLSPTTAIKRQWGERFRDMFLNSPEDFSELFSDDLHRVKLITSVTYQALYTAVEKVSETEEDADCSDVDIFAAMKQFGIKTVCLDEAHHLKNQWQKALEKFVSALAGEVKIISLTATPPYDSEGSEWERYLQVCGEIDEEIFVPELVGQNTLCPHQDYVFFNYPGEEETKLFAEFKERSAAALEELKTLELFRKLARKLNSERNYDMIAAHNSELVALAVLLRAMGYTVSETAVRVLTGKKLLPGFNMKRAEKALQFLLDGEYTGAEEKDQIGDVIKEYGLHERKKVCLELTEKLRRSLISSVGKLDSIRAIAAAELEAMGEKLRMLVLTDYIKKENLRKIGSGESFESLNIVSIFESLRLACPGVKIGALSGSLVILPADIELEGVKHKKTALPGTAYCTVEFSGTAKSAVEVVGRLFEKGEIQILVGTKSLLGEGWDSPCINSLILASFVGSFVSSNQMRGRAIRIDKNAPDKCANIWHLVTVEPDFMIKESAAEQAFARLSADKSELHSCDMEVLSRRFDSFMGPNYTTGKIESGIERLTAIKPPYDPDGIEGINSEMLSLARDRGRLREEWTAQVAEGGFEVVVETELPREKRVPVFNFSNIFLSLAAVLLELALVSGAAKALNSERSVLAIIIFVLMLLLLKPLSKRLRKMLKHINPARSVKSLGLALYKTLSRCGLIESSAKVEARENEENFSLSIRLRNASVHDQNVFNTAMAELLSPMEEPRYVLIAKSAGAYNYALSYACPTVIGKKKEYVEILSRQLKSAGLKFEPVYTRSEQGRAMLLKCRKRSYISFNGTVSGKKHRLHR